MAITAKRGLLWLAGLTVAAVAAGAVMLASVDRAKLLEQVRTQLEPRLKRQVKLGGGDFSLFPPRLVIDAVSISDEPGIGTTAFATAKQLEVRVGLFSLLRGAVDIESIVLRTPMIELIRKPDGVWNYESMGDKSSGDEGGAVAIQRFEIVDGTVAVTDKTKDGKRVAYEHIDLRLRDFAPGKRFNLEVAAYLAGAKDSTVAWKGSGTGATDMEGRLSLKNAAVSSLERFLDQKVTGLDASLTGDLDVRVKGDAAEAKGSLQAPGLSYQKRTADLPLRLDLEISSDTKTRKTRIVRGDLKARGVTLGLTGEVDGSNPKTVAKLRLTSKDSPLLDLRRLAALTGASTSYDTKGVLTADIAAEGPMDKLAFSGTASIKGLEIKSKEWKAAVRAPSVDLALTPTLLDARPFSVEAGRTRLTGAFSVANYLDGGTLNAEIKTAGAADLAELIHMAQAFGVSSDGASGEGSATIDLRIRGPLKNTDALDLNGTATLSGVTLQSPALTKPVTVASANIRFQENSATVENASVKLGGTAMSGRISVRNFSKPILDFAIEADRLDPTELSKLVKGSGAGAEPGASSAAGSGLSNISGGGTFRVGSLVLTDITLSQVSGRCQLRDGQLDVRPFTATLFKGNIEGAISGNFGDPNPMITVDARLAHVDANQLLSATTPAKQVVSGILGGDTKLRFRSGDAASLTKSLNGVVDFKLENGRINGVNLLNEIAKVARFMGYAKQDTAFTNVVLLAGTLDLRDGVATTNNLGLELDGAKLASTGNIDLNTQKLALKMTATLSKELSTRVGGNQVGGFMVTAMANEASQLVVPVQVTGPMANPKVTPDAEKFAQMKMKSMTPAKVTEAIQKITGSEDKLKGVLDIFKKKKKDGGDTKSPPQPPEKD